MIDPQERERRRQREFRRRRTDHERQAFYTSARWRHARAAFLGRNPLCVRCQADGLVVVATRVDHLDEVRDAPHLALDQSNLQALCEGCHNAKTAATIHARRRANQAAAGKRRPS